MQATTWILGESHADEQEGTSALASVGESSSSDSSVSAAKPTLVLYARASCSAFAVVPCADETGEELGWVSRKVFFKPALEWITRGVAAGPGAFFERATVFVRTTTASDVFAEALVGHLHAMTVLRELRGDATKATNSYDVATGGRRRLLWASVDES